MGSILSKDQRPSRRRMRNSHKLPLSCECRIKSDPDLRVRNHCGSEEGRELFGRESWRLRSELGDCQVIFVVLRHELHIDIVGATTSCSASILSHIE